MARPSPLAAAVTVTVVGVLPVFLLGGLAVQIRSALDIERSTLGALVAAFFAAAAVGALLSGQLSERWGPARVMRMSCWMAAGSMLAAAAAPAAGGLGGALFVAGLASGLGQPASNALISRAVAGHRRGLAFGAKQAAIPAAVLLSGIAVPVFGVSVGWRWAFVAGAVLAVAVAVAVRGLDPVVRAQADEETLAAAPTGRWTGERLAAVERRARAAAGTYHRLPLVTLAVGTMLAAAVGNSLGAFYVETAVAAGVRPGTAGLLAAVGSAVGIGMRLGVGALADRWTGRYLVVVASMMSVGALTCGILATGAQAVMLPAVVLAHGLGWAWPGLLTFSVALTHPEDTGRATGITQGGVSVGAALGPLLFGYLSDTAGLGTAWTVTALWAVGAAVAVLVGRALLLRRRPALAALVSSAGSGRGRPSRGSRPSRPSGQPRTWLAVGAGAVGITALTGLAMTAPWAVTTSRPEVVATGTGALPEGGVAGSSASCAQEYSLSALRDATFAFDGTVTAIDPGGPLASNQVTFVVEEWFLGDADAEVTLGMVAPVKPSGTAFNSAQDTTPSYTVGTRFLVSGSSRSGEPGMQDRIVWGCGFTRYHDSGTAADWREELSLSQ